MPEDAGSYNFNFTSAHASICGLQGYPDGRNVELRIDSLMDSQPEYFREVEQELLEKFKAGKENYIILWHLEEEPCIVQRSFADLFLLAKTLSMAGKMVKLHLHRRSSPEQNPVRVGKSTEQAVESSAEYEFNALGNQKGPATEDEAQDAMARALSKDLEREQDQPNSQDDSASEDDASSSTESRTEEADTSWDTRPADSRNIWPDHNPADFAMPIRTVGGPARTLGASNALDRPDSPPPERPEPWHAQPDWAKEKYHRDLKGWQGRTGLKHARRSLRAGLSGPTGDTETSTGQSEAAEGGGNNAQADAHDTAEVESGEAFNGG